MVCHALNDLWHGLRALRSSPRVVLLALLLLTRYGSDDDRAVSRLWEPACLTARAAAGIALAWMLSRFIAAALFQVQPHDGRVYAASNAIRVHLWLVLARVSPCLSVARNCLRRLRCAQLPSMNKRS
jgi:hypothetical protein